jgi:hypothetical protein
MLTVHQIPQHKSPPPTTAGHQPKGNPIPSWILTVMNDSELYIMMFKNDYSRSGEVEVKM